MRRARAVFVVALAAAMPAVPARAQEDSVAKDRCIDEAERAQQLRLHLRLLEGRALLAACSAPPCPAVVRRDCAAWLDEVEHAMPSLVVAVTGRDGQDVTDATIAVDDRVVTTAIGGDVALDPGAHRVRARLRDGRSQERAVVVREGEKQRLVTFAFSSAGSEQATDGARSRPLPASFWVLGGLGIVAAGAAAVTAVVVQNEYDDLTTTCGSHCSDAEVASVRWKLTTGRVLAGVGAAALVGAAVIWLVGRVGAPTGRRD